MEMCFDIACRPRTCWVRVFCRRNIIEKVFESRPSKCCVAVDGRNDNNRGIPTTFPWCSKSKSKTKVRLYYSAL